MDKYFDLGYIGIAATCLLAGAIPLATSKLGKLGRTLCWILVYLSIMYFVSGLVAVSTGLFIAWALVAVAVVGLSWHLGLQIGGRRGQQTDSRGALPIEEKEASVAFVSALLDYAGTLESQHKDIALLDLRNSSTRTLHLLGAAAQRVRLGDIALGAAQRTHRQLDEASILIDDLGWANFLDDRPDQAAENISDGVNLIDEVLSSGPIGEDMRLELTKLMVKAYRHRSGMTAIAGLSESLENLSQAEKHAQTLPQSVKVIELAGLDTAYAYVVAANFDATYSDTLSFGVNSQEGETLKTAIARANRSVSSYESAGDMERAAKAAAVRVRLVKRQASVRVKRAALAELERLRLAAARDLGEAKVAAK